MNAVGGAKAWFTAQELADLGLRGLPRTKRKINELAATQDWAGRTDQAGRALVRKREGRGGGAEYHRALLPAAATADLIARGLAADVVAAPSAPEDRDQRWAWFERQTDKVKDEASRRLQTLQAVEQLVEAGWGRAAAVGQAAGEQGVSAATIWNWLRLVERVRPDDRLPALAPVRRGGGREAEIDEGAWRHFLTHYLRQSQPTLASSYASTLEDYARPRGLTLPHPKTFARRVEREVHPQVKAKMRGGPEALRDTVPALKRSVAHFSALQAINIDGHKWDVLVNWPGREKPIRPMMVMIQDVYSRKVLAWRIGESESAALVQLALGDVFRKYGVPEVCYSDNGRAFASKWISGAAPYRFRGRRINGDPQGVAGEVGMKISFTRPYSGQSKPIERAFRDLEGRIGTHPHFEGAYTGNSVENKPENYGTRSVDLELFQQVVARGIELHNRRDGRRTETADGRSFDAAFAESYAASMPRRLGEEQLRRVLLPADKVTVDRKTGEIRLFGNSYWSPEHHDALLRLAGEPAFVRFDPEKLHGEIHVYDRRGGFVATVPVHVDAGFDNAEAARAQGALQAAARRKAREYEEALDLLTRRELLDNIPLTTVDPEIPAPMAVRPVRPSRIGAAAAAARLDAEPAGRSLIDRLTNLDQQPTQTQRPALRLVETEPGAGVEAPRPERGA